jgi:hypothetical protein
MPNWPRTSRTPAGSRLLPPVETARAAPASITRAPRVRLVKASQCLRLARRVPARKMVPTARPSATRSSTSRRRPLHSTVAAPPRAAARAASSLVVMPPRPKALADPWADCTICGVIASTTPTRGGRGRPGRGGSVYSPSTSVRITSRSAATRFTTVAERLSLSPKRISSVATVSFSLTMGTTPSSSSLSNVCRALRNRSRSSRPARVTSTWATLR